MIHHMTAIALRYSARRPARLLELTQRRSRFGRNVRVACGAPVPDALMAMKIDEIRARIERDAYAVDADDIADAIVQRLLAGKSVR